MPTISAINSNASSPPLRHPDKLFIGGKWINASSDAKFSVIAPHTEDVYVTVAEAGRSDINKAVAAARAAFDHGPWPSLSHAERAKYLHAIAERLRARAGDMAEIWPNEMGVTSAFAQAHMPRIADIYDFYATLGGSFGFEEQHQTSSGVGNVPKTVEGWDGGSCIG
ncbi:aldehyde dehydrogenase family protein [Burkholderia cenocepacia]|nr:aldehyde dehydrogenase family protein [Burkholderia cenocepacia]